MSANYSPGEQLTPKQQRFLEALLEGHTIVFSAGVAGVAEKTAHKWLHLPHFQQAHKAALSQMFDYTLTGLMQRLGKAIETLDRNMSDNPLVPPSTQVRAATVILEQSIQVFKLSEVEAGLAELKALLEESERRWQR